MNANQIELMKESAKTSAIVSFATSSAMQFRRVQKGEIDANEAGISIIKGTIQGTFGATAVVTAMRCNDGILTKLAILGIGLIGIYGIETIDENRKKLKGVLNAQ